MTRRCLSHAIPSGVLLITVILFAACGGAPSQPTPRDVGISPKQVPETQATAAPKLAEPGTTAAPKPTEPGATAAPKPSAPGATAAPKPTEPGATAAPEPSAPGATAAPGRPTTVSPTPAPQPTQAAAAALPPAQPPAVGGTAEGQKSASPTPVPTPGISLEPRVVELEWAPVMRLGNSEEVRLSLVPDQQGFLLGAETDSGKVFTRPVPIQRPEGYDLAAVATLTGVNFDVSPSGDQVRDLPEGQPVVWRWTIRPRSTGQHKLALALAVRQEPRDRSVGPPREFSAFSRGLDVRVDDVLGMSAPLAGALGIAGLIVGGGLGAVAMRRRPARSPRRVGTATIAEPNPALVLEAHPAVGLPPADQALLRALFRDYGRVVVESEFRSGYSGARTYLTRPIRADGRAEAAAIAKIGDRAAIMREYENFERLVKNTLPPMTARIQEPPVRLPGEEGAAVLRYTFVGAPNAAPVSLRRHLLQTNDPAMLYMLFDTFGPNWWMQRKPWPFRMAVEYDRMLPAHAVVAPETGGAARAIPGTSAPSAVRLAVGDRVALSAFASVERRADGQSLSLVGAASQGSPSLRVRWMGTTFSEGATGRVIATRESLLRDAAGPAVSGSADPITALPALLDETLHGTESIIHGDLNLENALVAGGLVWLIDFAAARLGHPLFDMAHLHADVIAHVIAPGLSDPAQIAGLMDAHPLLAALREIASRCLFDSARPREFDLALTVACLGALKYENLDAGQKRALYLAASRALPAPLHP